MVIKSILFSGCAWCLLGNSAAFAAELNPKVPLEGFKCFIENHERYPNQDETILVNFKTCPILPTALDRLTARGLSASLPVPRISQYQEVDILEFTTEQMKCLVDNADSIILQDKLENYVAIEPSPCGAIGFPVGDED